jgi:diadenosine tetraphosphate (Ap4A) HIT family hydrolase
MFELHPQLAKDCEVVGDLPLTRVLLNRDSLYPWLILVPRREAIGEIFQLSIADQQQLLQESSLVGEMMMAKFQADKLNVAALGNMVPQLHIHHIARYKNDKAWPNPVWGFATAERYEQAALQVLLEELRAEFSKVSVDFTI